MTANQLQQEKVGKSVGSRLTLYQPLLMTIFVSAIVAAAIGVRVQQHSVTHLMHNFMGVFLCIFALFKLFDLGGFKEGFAKYDLVARQAPTYGYAYPFIELLLGVLYLVYFLPTLTYILTIILMGIGGLGVMRAILRGLDTQCACMGTFLQVPLSTVSLTENLAMVLMAALMLSRSVF